MGWFFINVVVPLSLPIGALLVLKLAPLPKRAAARASVLSAIKDGQLCWVAVGMCASSIYELAEPLLAGKPASPLTGVALTGTVALLVIAALVAAAGTLFPTSLKTGNFPSAFAFSKHYRMMLGSCIVSLVVAGVYTLVHNETAALHSAAPAERSSK